MSIVHFLDFFNPVEKFIYINKTKANSRLVNFEVLHKTAKNY